MFSSMESNSGMSDEHRQRLIEELREADRAAAAPYISYPSTPWWYAPAIGIWFAAFVVVMNDWSQGSSASTGLVLFALILIELAFLYWMNRRHGALPFPGSGTAPPEINRLYRRYFATMFAVIVVVALVWWQVGVIGAAIVTFIVVTAGLAWYEKAYVAASEAVKARLA